MKDMESVCISESYLHCLNLDSPFFFSRGWGGWGLHNVLLHVSPSAIIAWKGLQELTFHWVLFCSNLYATFVSSRLFLIFHIISHFIFFSWWLLCPCWILFPVSFQKIKPLGPISKVMLAFAQYDPKLVFQKTQFVSFLFVNFGNTASHHMNKDPL